MSMGLKAGRAKGAAAAQAAQADKAPGWQLGPLCTMIVSVADFQGWLAAARPGDVLPYARGLTLPPGHPVPLLAREAQAAGLIQINQVRSAEDRRQFDYMARRLATLSAAAVAGAGAAGAGAADPMPDATRRRRHALAQQSHDAQRLYARLMDAAQRQAVCPGYDALARATNMSKEQVRYRMRQLVTAGLIAVTENGPGQPRTVCLIGTGHETRAPERAGIRRVVIGHLAQPPP